MSRSARQSTLQHQNSVIYTQTTNFVPYRCYPMQKPTIGVVSLTALDGNSETLSTPEALDQWITRNPTSTLQCLSEETGQVYEHHFDTRVGISPRVAQEAGNFEWHECAKKMEKKYSHHPQVIKDIITALYFQIGIQRTSKFKNMLQALDTRDYDRFVLELIDSKLSTQAPLRARERLDWVLDSDDIVLSESTVEKVLKVFYKRLEENENISQSGIVKHQNAAEVLRTRLVEKSRLGQLIRDGGVESNAPVVARIPDVHEKTAHHIVLPTETEGDFSLSVSHGSALLVAFTLVIFIIIFLSAKRWSRRTDNNTGTAFVRSDFTISSKVLGSGAIGVVYKGHTKQGVAVAAKTSLHKATGVHKEFDLGIEFDIQRKLEHKNIIKVLFYHVDRTSNPRAVEHIVFMELLSQGSMADLVMERGAIPEADIRKYLRDLLEGLAYIHSKNVLHRDIKPGNMMIADDGTVKLSDFGISRELPEGRQNGELTKTRHIVGTSRYMAPELFNEGEYSTGSDLWALACSVVRMASGQLPWAEVMNQGSSIQQHIQLCKTHPKIPGHVSNELRRLLEGLFHQEPSKRPSAIDVLRDPYFSSDAVPPPPAPIVAPQLAYPVLPPTATTVDVAGSSRSSTPETGSTSSLAETPQGAQHRRNSDEEENSKGSPGSELLSGATGVGWEEVA